jgi:hypothetical protein
VNSDTDLYSLRRLEARAEGAISSTNASATRPDSANEILNANAHDQLKEASSMTQVVPAVSGPSVEETEVIEEITRDAMPQEESGFALADGFSQEFLDFDAQLLEDICKHVVLTTIATSTHWIQLLVCRHHLLPQEAEETIQD